MNQSIKFLISTLGMVILIIMTILVFPISKDYEIIKPIPPNEIDNDSMDISVPIDRKLHQNKNIKAKDNQKNINVVEPLNPSKIPKKRVNTSIKILDALGMSIPKGMIFQATMSFDFLNGEFVYPDSFRLNQEFEIAAEGYFSKEMSHENIHNNTIILDYNTDYKIIVQDNQNRPVQDSTVKVWKLGPVPRPINQNIEKIPLNSRFYNQLFSSLQIKNTNIVFTEHSTEDVLLYRFRPDGYAAPRRGDKFVNLANCAWSEEYRPVYNIDIFNLSPKYIPLPINSSLKLRMWDTCSLIASISDNIEMYNTFIHPGISHLKFEFDRDGRRDFSYIRLPYFNEYEKKLFTKLKTGIDGISVLEKAEPSIYFVQAEKNTYHSNCIPLTPICGGVVLNLDNHSEVMVNVFLQKKNNGITYWRQTAPISNARVTLKSVRGMHIYSSVTNEIGVTKFEKVPFGSYELIISVSDSIVTKQEPLRIEINKPNKYVEYIIQDWHKYQVSGIVINEDTEEVIMNYPISLMYNDHIIDIKRTNKDGIFCFNDLLSGNYTLTGLIEEKNKALLIPFTNSNIVSNSFLLNGYDRMEEYGEYTIPSKKLTLKNQDVTDVKIYVKEYPKTTFSGKVVDEEGNAVQNAKLYCFETTKQYLYKTKQLQIFPKNTKSKSNGNFSFNVIGGKQAIEYVFEVIAFREELTPGYWKANLRWKDKYPSGSYIEERITYNQLGSTLISGFIDQHYENIIITLRERERKTATGTIQLEENNIKEINIQAEQFGLNLPVTFVNKNVFVIKNVQSGNLFLHLQPNIKDTVKTPFGERTYNKYLTKHKQFFIPMDTNSIIDMGIIKLENSGYAWGLAQDSQGIPIHDLLVAITDPENEQLYFGNTFTDENGFFFLGGQMPLNREYVLTAYDKKDTHKKIFQSSPFVNNISNYIIQINTTF